MFILSCALVLLLALYLLSLQFTPKGSLLHEIIFLPHFWWKVLSTKQPGGMQERRINYGQHPRQYLLCCRPPEEGPMARLAVIYFHGGGWRFGRPEQFRQHARLLNKLGYIAILPSYRRAPRHNYRHMREDLNQILPAARAWLNGEGLGHYPVVIGGMSAGGNLAALVALAPPTGLPENWLRGLFALGAPLNLERMRDSPTLRHFAGPRNGAMFREASPVNYLNQKLDIPALILHGTHDGMVEFDSVAEFSEQLKRCNQAATRFVVLKGNTHLEVASWVFREGPARQALLDWLKERSR